MSQENKAFIHRYVDSFNRDPESALEQHVSDEALKQHTRTILSAFPGYQLQAEDMIAEGDKVAVRLLVQGTHRGELFGIRPTGKQVTVEGIIIYRIADERIIEHWLQMDMMGLMQQLGAGPPM